MSASHIRAIKSLFYPCGQLSDFIKLRQGKFQSVQEYYERFIVLKKVNASLKNSVHEDAGLLDIVAKKYNKLCSAL